jgi:hypothetical protein
MARSLAVTGNFIFKLHVAALEELRPGIKLYPVMDGMYITTPDRNEMRTFLSDVFQRLAILFNGTTDNQHRFLLKAAVAYGPVIHGANVTPNAQSILSQNTHHKDSMLLGMPMIYAHISEPEAPPFGVCVHNSASSFLDQAERKWSQIWWPWFPLHTNAQAQSLRTNLPGYFDWCNKRAGVIGYELSRIAVHKAQADHYFVDA